MNKTWEHIGSKDPYWGVLSTDEYRSSNVDAAALERFFASGEVSVAERIAIVEQTFGSLNMEVALDYGCGVGRLSRALANRFRKVISVDISESMLKIAKENLADKNVEFEHAESMTQTPVNFILSLLVIQHIEPSIGMDIIQRLAKRLHGVGLLEIPHRYRVSGIRKALGATKRAIKKVLPMSEPYIEMHLYDIPAVIKLLERECCSVVSSEFIDRNWDYTRLIFRRA